MIEQTFAIGDLAKVALLFGLEILLSADNAIVLAILVRHLPERLQQKALFYGLAGAFVFRGLAILAATWIIGLWWVQLIGAGYLMFLAAKHFIKHGGGEKQIKVNLAGFWLTIFYVEMTDVAFAIDSVLVAVATEPKPDKVWVVYAGAMIGVLALRWAAKLFLRLLKMYPVLEHVAYILVGWAGCKLLMLGGHTLEKWFKVEAAKPASTFPAWPSSIHLAEMPLWLFWGGVAAVVAWGLYHCKKDGPAPEEDVEAALQEAELVPPADPETHPTP